MKLLQQKIIAAYPICKGTKLKNEWLMKKSCMKAKTKKKDFHFYDALHLLRVCTGAGGSINFFTRIEVDVQKSLESTALIKVLTFKKLFYFVLSLRMV